MPLAGSEYVGRELRRAQALRLRELLRGSEMLILSGAPPLDPDSDPPPDAEILWHCGLPEFSEPDKDACIHMLKPMRKNICRRGIARWFRIIDGDGVALLDGLVGVCETDHNDIVIKNCDFRTDKDGELTVSGFDLLPVDFPLLDLEQMNTGASVNA